MILYVFCLAMMGASMLITIGVSICGSNVRADRLVAITALWAIATALSRLGGGWILTKRKGEKP